jgi:hypothetical protein
VEVKQLRQEVERMRREQDALGERLNCYEKTGMK